MDIVRWLGHHVEPYRGRLWLLIALATAEVALRVLLPWPMMAVVDQALGDRPVSPWLLMLPGVEPGDRQALLITLVVLAFVIQTMHQGVLMAHTRVFTATGHRVTRDLRQRLFTHLQGLNLRHHTRTPIGDSVYRLSADAGCLEQLLLRGVLPLTFSTLTLVVMFTILARIHLSLALVSLSVVPFLFVWIRWSARRIQPRAEQVRVLESRMTARLHESFAAIRLVKSFGREPYEGRRFSGAADEAMQARVQLSAREALFSTIVGSLIVVGSSLVVLVGGLLVIRGRLSVGTLLLALAYLGFVYGPLSGIANTTAPIEQALASARRVRETLSLSPEIDESPGAIEAKGLTGRVDFEHVSFAYDDRAVLDDLTFSAQPGEMIALVGPSGSGKTTLVSLIPRFFEPTGGRILIDGRESSGYTLRSLRQNVAIVLQEAVVLSGTVLENLRYGRLDASDEDVIEAARAAHAHDFTMALPNGYQTELGEAGSGLSVGQKQRLSMARAFLKNAPILVLDEPTAALDTISERLVFSALNRLRAGRTTFVIAHRLSTVRHADRILVLDAGRIVAQGTHDELLVSSPLYRRLATELTDATVHEV